MACIKISDSIIVQGKIVRQSEFYVTISVFGREYTGTKIV